MTTASPAGEDAPHAAAAPPEAGLPDLTPAFDRVTDDWSRELVRGATAPTPVAQTVGDLEPQDANPPLLFDLRTQLGGPRGVFDSSFPGVVMAVTAVFTKVGVAIVAALAAAALLALVRLVRREPVRQTAMSLGGILLCYLLARTTGSTKTFFLPGILLNGAYAAALLVSVLVRMPLLGFVAAALDARYAHWQRHAPLRRAAYRATLLWVALFAIRFVVVGALYLANDVRALPLTRVLLGLPVYLITIGLTVLLLRPHARTADAPGADGPGADGPAADGPTAH